MNRAITAAAAALPALLWTTSALAQGYGGRDGYWSPMSGWGHMMFSGLMMLAFWVLIIVLIVLLVRWLIGPQAGDRAEAPPRSSALQILEERFARGEIDKEEFEERKRYLSG